MNNETDIRKPSNLRTYKSEISQNIEELKNRIDNLNAELDKVKSEMKTSIENLDDPEYQKELTRITSLRETAAEMLSERQQELEDLNAELKKALAKQKQEEHFSNAVRVTKEAKKNWQRHDELIEKFDEVAAPIIQELVDLHSKWKVYNDTFMNDMLHLESSFKSRHNDKLDKEQKREASKRRKELLQKVEEEAGTTTERVRTQQFIQWRYWQNVYQAAIELRKSEYGAYNLMKNVLRKCNEEAERKRRNQAKELQQESEAAE